MNDETKNTLNTNNENNLEMPAMANNVVKPIPVTEQPAQTPQPETPVTQSVGNTIVKPIPVEEASQAPVQPQSVTPTPVATPAPEALPQKEVGTVVVGQPMSNVVKPIPVGDIQGMGPVATVGGGAPVDTKKKSNIVAGIILVAGIIFLIGYVLFTYVLKDKIGNTGLTGTLKNGYLVYSNPKKGDKIGFTLTDTLKLIVTVDEYEVQDNVGTKVGVSIKEADGSDSVSIKDIWLTDDNALNINYSKVGNYAVIQSSSSSIINVIGFDGKVVIFDDLSSYVNEEKGLTVRFSSALEDKIEIEATRVDNGESIHYGDVVTEVDLTTIPEEEQEKYSRYLTGDGFSMCIDDVTKIPETTTMSALFTFSIKEGKIDFTTPEVTEKTDFKSYYETNKDLICQ